jgi:hypothetical protein
MTAPAPATGAEDDRSRRICPDRRATAERNIARARSAAAAGGTAPRGWDGTGRDATGRRGARAQWRSSPGRFEGDRRRTVRTPAVRPRQDAGGSLPVKVGTGRRVVVRVRDATRARARRRKEAVSGRRGGADAGLGAAQLVKVLSGSSDGDEFHLAWHGRTADC